MDRTRPHADASDDELDQADAELAMHWEAAEDAEDVAIAVERMAAIREGREKVLSPEESAKILAGGRWKEL